LAGDRGIATKTGPSNWPKPWSKNIELRVGSYNPLSDAAKPGGHPTGTATWLSPPAGPKYAVDFVPDDQSKKIEIYSPVSGTIECANFAPSPSNPPSCKKGHGGYGNHIVITADDLLYDKNGKPSGQEQILIAHLAEFNPDLSKKKRGDRIEVGEYLGIMGNTANTETGASWSTVHVHLELTKHHYQEDLEWFGIKKSEFNKGALFVGDISND
jgi:murein DD-endopeptidase MepM/ murein hydrolase activator NlpD